ncbi:MAG: type II toxin-antitoxin system VapB family antitoxin [Nitrospirae bacterium]|nr:type II toxin-antitoxin system VapB family antitoxin [Nitrospirota bacterium]
MRTTIDINDKLIDEVIKASGAKSKKGAVVIALQEYIKAKKREELKNLIGSYDEFGLSLKDLEKIRREE